MNKWSRRWYKRQRAIKNHLGNSRIRRILGKRIFHNDIWRVNLESVAGGLSLGLFIAFTPTIPFQMFLCTIGAVLLGVNLPVALLACWVTNPLTALPVYLASYRLGRYLFENSGFESIILLMFSFQTRVALLMKHSLWLWTGSLVFSAAAATIGNIAVRILWNIFLWLKAIRKS